MLKVWYLNDSAGTRWALRVSRNSSELGSLRPPEAIEFRSERRTISVPNAQGLDPEAMTEEDLYHLLMHANERHGGLPACP